MKETFEYSHVVTALNQIEIESIGNVCLCLKDDHHLEYYLAIFTEDGFSEVFEYGPNCLDFDALESGLKVTYYRFEYNERKLIGIIESFLNKKNVVVESVEEVEPSYIRENIKDVGVVLDGKAKY